MLGVRVTDQWPWYSLKIHILFNLSFLELFLEIAQPGMMSCKLGKDLACELG